MTNNKQNNNIIELLYVLSTLTILIIFIVGILYQSFK
jgi:hypothetical protein